MGAPLTVLLADTSLWHHRRNPSIVERWATEVTADRVATTEPVRLEVLYSAQTAAFYDEISAELDGLRQFECDGDAMSRALEVQRLLAHRRPLHHRSVRIPDLLIAAVAEINGAIVWHYDEDFDRVAAVTGQPTEWIVERGAVS